MARNGDPAALTVFILTIAMAVFVTFILGSAMA